ncbi:MAG: L,D-transpeptidase [Candidatus Manganitrophaceae bacterium]|nr:MAG: L,D-transpeptidase [Candidatus Manganitrophaceae bacterium]
MFNFFRSFSDGRWKSGWGLLLAGLLLLTVGFLFLSIKATDTAASLAPGKPAPSPGLKKRDVRSELAPEDQKLRKAIQSLSPKGIYAVVDTAKNRLWLKRGESVVYEAVVSTGSGTTLTDPKNPDRRWLFETPRGEFRVQSKIRNPVWIKPDWAFIEEGEALPIDARDRVEGGVLGEYAIAFGNGYFIHGTLYTRMLGQNVTHGCIRMADKDLEVVYKSLPNGAPIYIF